MIGYIFKYMEPKSDWLNQEKGMLKESSFLRGCFAGKTSRNTLQAVKINIPGQLRVYNAALYN